MKNDEKSFSWIYPVWVSTLEINDSLITHLILINLDNFEDVSPSVVETTVC